MRPLPVQTTLFFGVDTLDRVIAQAPQNAPFVRALLEKLETLQTNGQMELHAISGYLPGIGKQKLETAGLDRFFKNRYYEMTPAYWEAKNPHDREVFDRQRNENPEMTDDYYKQTVILEWKNTHANEFDRAFLIGHDLLTHGYYSTFFSKIEPVFVQSAFAFGGEPLDRLVPGLRYCTLEPDGFLPAVDPKTPRTLEIVRKIAAERLAKALLGESQLESLGKQIREKKGGLS